MVWKDFTTKTERQATSSCRKETKRVFKHASPGSGEFSELSQTENSEVEI